MSGTTNPISTQQTTPLQKQERGEATKQPVAEQKNIAPPTVPPASVSIKPDEAYASIQAVVKKLFEEIQEEQPRQAGVLTSMTYSFANNSMNVTLQSATQETIFNELKKELTDRVRAALSIATIQIVVRLEDTKDKAPKPYSPQDKYNFLKSKNELLDKLKDKFNLNIKQ